MTLSNTPNEILVELRQTRLAHLHNSLVLVEGSTDEALWKEFKAEKCNLFPMGGKQHVLKAIQAVNRTTSLQGVAAIVDADYWLVEKSKFLLVDNILCDDLPDMELILFESPAFEKVLRHTINVSNVIKFTDDLRERALAIAMEYGYFRLIDARYRNFGLSFRSVSFERVIDIKSSVLNQDQVAELLTERAGISKSRLLEALTLLRDEIPPQKALCRGKDVLAIVAHLISVDHEISEKAKLQTKSGEMSRAMRMSYEFSYFIQTKLYERIRVWEDINRPFRIIRDFPAEVNAVQTADVN